MKQFLKAIVFIALAIPYAQAQTAYDAFKYSVEAFNGSARYTAMAGSFGALGGDFSAVVDNPAGAAVFQFPEVGISMAHEANNNGASYNGNFNSIEFSNTMLHQFGLVIPLKDNNTESDWPKIAFAFNYKRQNDFDEKYRVLGTSTRGIDQYFLYYANGIELQDLILGNDETVDGVYRYLGNNVSYGAQQAFLGFQGYIVNAATNTPRETAYVSNAQYTRVQQDYFVKTAGKNNKYAFTLSGAYKNKLYLGLSVNSHKIEFSQTDDLVETGFSNASNVERIQFNNELNTYGNGFSIQVGGIAVLSNALRLGVSYHSPTWLNLYDESRQFLITDHYDQDRFIEETVAPDIINTYPEYYLHIPGKVTGSVAYVFGTKGLLNFDYTQRHYGNAQFDEEDASTYLSSLNTAIQQRYATSTRMALGGEYRFQKISVRGGFFSETNRIKNTTSGMTGYSFGLGYTQGGNSWALSLVQQEIDFAQPLYSEGLTNTVNYNRSPFQITLSYNFKL